MDNGPDGVKPRHVLNSQQLLNGAVFAVLAATIIVPRVWYADLIEAEVGFGVRDYIISITRHADMHLGTPEGVASYGVSLPMRLARVLCIFMGLDPTNVQRAYYALEPIAIAASGWLLVRALIPRATSGFYAVFLILFAASNLRNSNFGTWPSPFYSGSFYAFAECFGTIGIVLLLKRKYAWAALVLAFAFSCHLAVALGFIAFASGVLLFRWLSRSLSLRTFLLSGAAFCVPVALWLYCTLDPQSVAGGNITAKDWRALAFAASFHTFPIDAGLFGLRHQTYFAGFVAFSLLFIVYFSRYFDHAPYGPDIVAGVVAVSALVVVGLVASSLKLDPILLKLHLHRLNGIILLVGSPYVICGLWDDVKTSNVFAAITAALAIAMPFYLNHGIAVMPAFLLALSHALTEFRARGATARAGVLAAGLTAAFAIFCAYFGMGYLRGIAEPMYSGASADVLVLACTLALVAIVVASKFRPPVERVSAVARLILIGVLAVRLQTQTWPLAFGGVARAEDFYDVQLWAKMHTAPRTIFVVDPSHSYGWRGFSERPTMGSIREWLYTNVVYVGDLAALRRGLELLEDFGLSREKYLSGGEPLDGYYYALFRLRQTYCRSGPEWFAYMRTKYAVEYFVFEKAYCFQPPNIPIKFENASFYVGRVP